MSLPARRVTLQTVLPDLGQLLRFDLVGDDTLSGGVAVWNGLDRPRRRAAVEFAGVSGFTYVLPLLLDGVEYTRGADRSVELECQTLVSWASEVRKGTKQPVVLQATGPLLTGPAVRWVIGGLEWGAKIRDPRTGNRIQQYVTVTLTEYRAATVRKSSAKQSRDHRGK